MSEEPKDWLILSLKWSRGSEDLVWYKSNSCGYTTDLNKAGRYTKQEAISREVPQVTLAVPVKSADRKAETFRVVEAGKKTVEAFKRARRRAK